MKKGYIGVEEVLKAALMIVIILFLIYFITKIKTVGTILANLFG